MQCGKCIFELTYFGWGPLRQEKKKEKTKKDMNVSDYAGNAQQQLKDQYKITMALNFRSNRAITLRLLININKSVCENEQFASA